MGLDILSPAASAQVNVLLLPAARTRKSRFETFVSRLKEVYDVRLGDVRPNAGSGSFSPQVFPSGRLLFSFSTSDRPNSTVNSFPFELNREPQVVLALADGDTLVHDSENQHEGKNLGGDVAESTNLQSLLLRLEDLKPHYRRAIVHRLVVFDMTGQSQEDQDVIFVPPLENSRMTTMRTVMCDIGALFLDGLHDLANALQDLPALESPSVVASEARRNGAQDSAANARQRMSMPLSGSPNASHGGTSNGLSQTGATAPTSNTNSEMSSRDKSRNQFSTTDSAASVPSTQRIAARRGRALVVKGAMYLEAGRWPDALKTLSEGVAVAQANIDYLWHARGLEQLLVCMLLLIWAEVPFEIPSVCLPSAEQRSRTGPTFYTPASSNEESVPPVRGASDIPPTAMQHLTSLFPDVIRTILTMYTRAIAFTTEKLPQLLICEVKIRLVGLLFVISRSKTSFDRHLLGELFRENGLGKAEHAIGMSSNFTFRKDELANLLLEAIPPLSEQSSLSESLEILIGISSLLFHLGLGRKQAFFLKEVLSAMTPGLVEARKIGAAEMGIHPSAGLPMLQGASKGAPPSLNHSIKALLGLVGKMYGVPYGQDGSLALDSNSGVHAIGTKMRVWADSRIFGDPALKMEILRYCVNLCEALPDLQGILTFAVQLLHTARNVIMLPPTHLFGPPSMSQEEQTRLFNTIKRTVGAATRLGQNHLLAEYWDDFLIRGIEPLDPSERSRLIMHSPQDLAAVTTPSTALKKDPFIYSSFAKTKAKSRTNVVLTIGEMVYFAVILQNPFEFDVEVDRISLISEGCQFAASDHSIVLGHYCSQKFIMSGKPIVHGTLRITGCRARIRYCHERTFHIFSKQWRPEPIIKLKPQRSPTGSSSSRDPEQAEKPTSVLVKDPEPDVLSLTVLHAQPMLSVIESTPWQPAVMLLEGESKLFQITLHNASTTASADLLLFTFQDSATTQLQDALAEKELSPAELYELQLQLAATPSLRWVSEDSEEREASIPAGSSSTFRFEVFGKPGLLSGVIQVDYAHVGVPRSEMKETFYTRQLRYPISLTVNGAIEIPRCNVLPFTGDFAWSNQQRVANKIGSANGNSLKSSPQQRSRPATDTAHPHDDDQLMPLLSRLGLGSHGSDHCLLLLDLRNVWPNPLSISIQVRERPAKVSSPTDPWRRAYTVHELLQPSHVSRVVLLLPRLFIRDPHAPIPLIGNQRQFVVSASKLSAENEAASRETFWYREELLKYISGRWREDLTGREGEINMRKGIRLSARMIDAIRVEEVEIDFSVRGLKESSQPENERIAKDSVMQTGRAHFVLQTNTFATLTAYIRNHSSDRLHVLLRLQPSLRNQPHNVALDLSKRFAWTGMLQRALHPPLEAGESREADLGIIALCQGDFEVGATVEEIRPNVKQPTQSSGLSLVAPKRRIWHAREPCLVDAVDGEDS
jgi:trafficking protein particle complex subunit 9